MIDPAQPSPGADGARFEERLLGELPRLERFVGARYPKASGDVVQETLLRAWRARGSFDPSRDMWPWLRVVADNAATRRMEKESRSEASVSMDAASIDAASEAAHLEARATALYGGSAGHDSTDLSSFLSRLRPADRAVVEGHYFHGSSLAELAAERACPVGTVKSQLSRARKRLAALLGGAMLIAVSFVGLRAGPGATPDSIAPDSTALDSTAAAAELRSHSISIKVERSEAPSFATRDLSTPKPPVWEVKKPTLRRRAKRLAPSTLFRAHAPAFPIDPSASRSQFP